MAEVYTPCHAQGCNWHTGGRFHGAGEPACVTAAGGGDPKECVFAVSCDMDPDDPAEYMEALAAYRDRCPECHGLGYTDDETACGDPDHCNPWKSCPRGCRPEDDYQTSVAPQ